MTPVALALDLGSIPTLVGIVAILVGAWIGLRSRGTTEVLRAAVEAQKGSADAWKEERDAEVAKSARVELEKQALEARVAELEARVKELEAKTDLTTLAQQQTKLYESAMQEIRAAFNDLHKQSTGIVSLLSLLRDQMTPDVKEGGSL